jgi:hypothetical protein
MINSGFHSLVFHYRNRPFTKLDLFANAGGIRARHVLTWTWQVDFFVIVRIPGHLEPEKGSLSHTLQNWYLPNRDRFEQLPDLFAEHQKMEKSSKG